MLANKELAYCGWKRAFTNMKRLACMSGWGLTPLVLLVPTAMTNLVGFTRKRFGEAQLMAVRQETVARSGVVSDLASRHDRRSPGRSGLFRLHSFPRSCQMENGEQVVDV